MVRPCWHHKSGGASMAGAGCCHMHEFGFRVDRPAHKCFVELCDAPWDGNDACLDDHTRLGHMLESGFSPCYMDHPIAPPSCPAQRQSVTICQRISHCSTHKHSNACCHLCWGCVHVAMKERHVIGAPCLYDKWHGACACLLM
jgi:hypothetical protein